MVWYRPLTGSSVVRELDQALTAYSKATGSGDTTKIASAEKAISRATENLGKKNLSCFGRAYFKTRLSKLDELNSEGSKVINLAKIRFGSKPDINKLRAIITDMQGDDPTYSKKDLVLAASRFKNNALIAESRKVLEKGLEGSNLEIVSGLMQAMKDLSYTQRQNLGNLLKQYKVQSQLSNEYYHAFGPIALGEAQDKGNEAASKKNSTHPNLENNLDFSAFEVLSYKDILDVGYQKNWNFDQKTFDRLCSKVLPRMTGKQIATLEKASNKKVRLEFARPRAYIDAMIERVKSLDDKRLLQTDLQGAIEKHKLNDHFDRTQFSPEDLADAFSNLGGLDSSDGEVNLVGTFFLHFIEGFANEYLTPQQSDKLNTVGTKFVPSDILQDALRLKTETAMQT